MHFQNFLAVQALGPPSPNSTVNTTLYPHHPPQSQSRFAVPVTASERTRITEVKKHMPWPLLPPMDDSNYK